jgi:hypothetical protein
LPVIESNLNDGVVPTFSGAPLTSLRNMVFEMIKRTPAFTAKHDDLELGTQIVAQALNDIDESSDTVNVDRLNSLIKNSVRLKALGRHIRVRAVISKMPKVAEALKSFSVRWAVSNTKHSYILSGLAAYRIGNGGHNGLSNKNCEIWMPITPKIAIVLFQDDENSIPLVVFDTPDHIRQVNLFAAANSGQIASHSKLLIESITGKKARP